MTIPFANLNVAEAQITTTYSKVLRRPTHRLSDPVSIPLLAGPNRHKHDNPLIWRATMCRAGMIHTIT